MKSLLKGDESNNRIKWSLYGRVWREIGRPQWKWLLAGIVATIGAAGAEAYTITLVQQIVDKAFIQKSMQSIYFFGLQIIAAFGFKGIFSYAKSLIMAKAGLLASANLQKRIYNHMVKMNISKFFGIRCIGDVGFAVQEIKQNLGRQQPVLNCITGSGNAARGFIRRRQGQ